MPPGIDGGIREGDRQVQPLGVSRESDVTGWTYGKPCPCAISSKAISCATLLLSLLWVSSGSLHLELTSRTCTSPVLQLNSLTLFPSSSVIVRTDIRLSRCSFHSSRKKVVEPHFSCISRYVVVRYHLEAVKSSRLLT